MLLLVAPLVWISGSSVFAYNSYLLVSLCLNGCFAWKFLRGRQLGIASSFLAGAAVVLLPINHWQLGVLQLVPLWAILWSWDTLLSSVDARDQSHNPESRQAGSLQCWIPKSISSYIFKGAGWGLATSCVFAMSVHHGLFHCMLLSAGIGFVVLVAVVRKKRIGCLFCFLSAGLVVQAVLVGPLLLRHHNLGKRNQLHRDLETIESLSAKPTDYAKWYGRSLVRVPGVPASHFFLGLGAITSVLCIAGVLVGLYNRKSRFWVAFLVCIGLMAFALSLGSHLRIGSYPLWSGLAGFIPGLEQVRSVYRFGYFFQLAFVLTGACLLELLLTQKAAAWRWSGLCLGLLSLADPFPHSARLGVSVSQADREAEWVQMLSTRRDGAVLMLPMPAGGSARDYEYTVEWMILGLVHQRPIVNGYSGFFPQHTIELAERLEEEEFSSALVTYLRNMGVRYITIFRRDCAMFEAATEDLAVHRLSRQSDDIVLYEISVEEARSSSRLEP